MKKKLFCIGMVITLSLIFVGCNTDNGLQKQIDVLQARLVAISEEMNKISNENNDLKKKIETTQNDNRLLKSKIFDLKDAYEKNIVSKEDVKHISYFFSGEVVEVRDEYKNEAWNEHMCEINNPEAEWVKIKRLDFTPKIENTIPDTTVEKDIKTAFFLKNLDLFRSKPDEDFYGGPDDLKVRFLGKYGENYALALSSDIWSFGTACIYYNIADIVFADQTVAYYKIFAF